MEIKYKKNMSFLEVRKTVDLYMKENTYAVATRRTSSISNDKQSEKYKARIEKLIQLVPSDWPKFQEQFRRMHSVEMKLRECRRNIAVIPTK